MQILKQVEIWKSVDGYEGYYDVSSFGRIKSLDREITINRKTKNGKTVKRIKKGRILKLSHNGRGYYKVDLYKDKVYTTYLHRLVALHFLPGADPEMTVNHKDLDKSNNRADNLEMVSNQQNINHAVDNGRMHGTTNPNRAKKLKISDIHQILKHREQGMYFYKIAEKFGVCKQTICDICKQKSDWNISQIKKAL